MGKLEVSKLAFDLADLSLHHGEAEDRFVLRFTGANGEVADVRVAHADMERVTNLLLGYNVDVTAEEAVRRDDDVSAPARTSHEPVSSTHVVLEMGVVDWEAGGLVLDLFVVGNQHVRLGFGADMRETLRRALSVGEKATDH